MTRAARVRAHLDIVTANAARYEQWGKPVSAARARAHAARLRDRLAEQEKETKR